MIMKQITFVRDGQVVIFENPDIVPLRYGTATWRNARWILSDEVLAILKAQNPDVEFVEGQPVSK
jgi:hypothetical protein